MNSLKPDEIIEGLKDISLVDSISVSLSKVEETESFTTSVGDIGIDESLISVIVRFTSSDLTLLVCMLLGSIE